MLVVFILFGACALFSITLLFRGKDKSPMTIVILSIIMTIIVEWVIVKLLHIPPDWGGVYLILSAALLIFFGWLLTLLEMKYLKSKAVKG